jgi:hypothetical protein
MACGNSSSTDTQLSESRGRPCLPSGIPVLELLTFTVDGQCAETQRPWYVILVNAFFILKYRMATWRHCGNFL